MIRPVYYFVFAYADGHTEGVTAAEGSCGGGITIGDGQPRGTGGDASDMFAEFTSALGAQRARTTPPADAQTEVSCDTRGHTAGLYPISTLPSNGVPDLTKAVLCWSPNGNSEQPTQEAKFATADLQLVIASMKADASKTSSTTEASCGHGTLNYRIIGENAWGDRYLLAGYCGEFNLSESGGTGFWRPHGETADIFSRMVGTGTDRLAMPTADSAPEDVVRTWADLLNDGDVRADQLWVDGHSPVAADLKPVSVSPKFGSEPGHSAYPATVTVLAYYGDKAAHCGFDRMKQFVLVRSTAGESWRILSWSNQGPANVGC
jgi:hypothetical protein